MISQNEIKYFSSLLQKKYRKRESKFIVEGRKTVLEGIKSEYECEVALITEKFQQKEHNYLDELKSSGIQTIKIKSSDFRRLSDTKSPEGIAAVFNKYNNKPVIKKLKDKIIVYLDDISDPGNVGTIIRNCDWFGINTIFLSSESAEIFNPKVIRASMGSIFHINAFEDIPLTGLSELKDIGYEFVVADTSGDDVFDFIKSSNTILFFSNESAGPSDELLSTADRSVTISGKGRAESLNVASSSAILLAELTK